MYIFLRTAETSEVATSFRDSHNESSQKDGGGGESGIHIMNLAKRTGGGSGGEVREQREKVYIS